MEPRRPGAGSPPVPGARRIRAPAPPDHDASHRRAGATKRLGGRQTLPRHRARPGQAAHRARTGRRLPVDPRRRPPRRGHIGPPARRPARIAAPVDLPAAFSATSRKSAPCAAGSAVRSRTHERVDITPTDGRSAATRPDTCRTRPRPDQHRHHITPGQGTVDTAPAPPATFDHVHRRTTDREILPGHRARDRAPVAARPPTARPGIARAAAPGSRHRAARGRQGSTRAPALPSTSADPTAGATRVGPGRPVDNGPATRSQPVRSRPEGRPVPPAERARPHGPRPATGTPRTRNTPPGYACRHPPRPPPGQPPTPATAALPRRLLRPRPRPAKPRDPRGRCSVRSRTRPQRNVTAAHRRAPGPDRRRPRGTRSREESM